MRMVQVMGMCRLVLRLVRLVRLVRVMVMRLVCCRDGRGLVRVCRVVVGERRQVRRDKV